MIPVPGSVVSTRSRRRAASGVPSATTTMPAWIEYPMPTPPPWCTDTHVAPDAVLRSALRTGQSAIAYAIADWPVLNALLNTASGATWVSVHHGGGVGI